MIVVIYTIVLCQVTFCVIIFFEQSFMTNSTNYYQVYYNKTTILIPNYLFCPIKYEENVIEKKKNSKSEKNQ